MPERGRITSLYLKPAPSLMELITGLTPAGGVPGLADKRARSRPGHETALYTPRRASGETGCEVSAGDRQYARALRFKPPSYRWFRPVRRRITRSRVPEIRLTVVIPPAVPENPVPSEGPPRSSVSYWMGPGEPLVALASERLMVRRRVAAFWDGIAVFIGRRPVQALPTRQTKAVLPPIPTVEALATA